MKAAVRAAAVVSLLAGPTAPDDYRRRLEAADARVVAALAHAGERTGAPDAGLAQRSALARTRSAREDLETAGAPPEVALGHREELAFFNHAILALERCRASGCRSAAELGKLASIVRRGLTHRDRALQALSTDGRAVAAPESREARAMDPIGKTFVFDYGALAIRAHYASGSDLAWEQVRGPEPGSNGAERYERATIRPDVYFLWWREKDGSVVGQVADFAKKRAHTVWVPPGGPAAHFEGRIEDSP